jgi:O-antigen ligase
VTLLRAAEPFAGLPLRELPALAEAGTGWRGRVELAAGAVALIGFALFVVQAGGGRDDTAVTKGLLSLAPAFLLTRPWARLAPGVLLAGLLPTAGALLMCLTSPTRWAGAEQLATAGYAGLAFLTVAALASTSAARELVSTGLATTGVVQALYALWVWSADGDLTEPLFGTYYWHNPFAAHVGAAGLLLAASYLMHSPAAGPSRARVAVLPGALLCLVAVHLSTSRATAAVVVVITGALVGGLLWRAPGRRRTAVRAGVLAVLVVAVVSALSPVVADRSAAPARTEGETLTSSGGHRVDFYAAAVAVVRDHPWTGVGAGGFTAAATEHQGPLEARARNVHNGLLQAAVDGGLPLVAAYAVPLLLGAAAWRARLRALPAGPDRNVLLGAGAAAGLLVVHSLVDFDWTFPALPVLLGALLGLVVAVPTVPLRQGPRVAIWADRPVSAQALLALLLLLAVVVVSVRADVAEAAVRSRVLPTADAVLTGVSGPLRDPRFDRLVLTDPRSEPSALRRSLARTEATAELDATLQWERALALVRLGERDEAVRLAAERWLRLRGNNPQQVLGYARVLDAAGRPGDAERALLDAARDLLALGPDGAMKAERLALIILARERSGPPRDVHCLVAAVRAATPMSALPRPPAEDCP